MKRALLTTFLLFALACPVRAELPPVDKIAHFGIGGVIGAVADKKLKKHTKRHREWAMLIAAVAAVAKERHDRRGHGHYEKADIVYTVAGAAFVIYF